MGNRQGDIIERGTDYDSATRVEEEGALVQQRDWTFVAGRVGVPVEPMMEFRRERKRQDL